MSYSDYDYEDYEDYDGDYYSDDYSDDYTNVSSAPRTRGVPVSVQEEPESSPNLFCFCLPWSSNNNTNNYSNGGRVSQTQQDGVDYRRHIRDPRRPRQSAPKYDHRTKQTKITRVSSESDIAEEKDNFRESMRHRGTSNDLFIAEHNRLRSRHNARPLSHDKSLSNQAQRWADNLAQMGKMVHSEVPGGSTISQEHIDGSRGGFREGFPYGENLAMSENGALDPVRAVKMWHSEVAAWERSNGENISAETGHFTQLVWKNSRKIGWGAAKGKNGSTFIVAMYYPPGNITGHYDEQVE